MGLSLQSTRISPCLILFAISGLLISSTSGGSVVNTEIECYLCSSDLDSSCIDNPRATTTCPTTHGKGCATRLLYNDIVERGCSDIGLTPHGCQVSEIFGTECVCHQPRCNMGIPAGTIDVDQMKHQTIDCYQCNNLEDPTCLYDITPHETEIKTCPTKNGCFFMRRINENGITLYHRLCFDGVGPATYYPGGCYTVFNEKTSTSSEVCVCYADKCNRNSLTSLDSSSTKKENTSLQSSSDKEKTSPSGNNSKHNRLSNITLIIFSTLIIILKLVDIT